MSEIEVKLPSLGKDAGDKATVSFFFVSEGDQVKEGADFCEMFTDKATFVVPCPVAGTLKSIAVHENDVVQVGQVLAIVEM